MSPSPENLWKRFTADIATPPAKLSPEPHDGFDEVMARIRDLSATLPPHALQVIDRELFERGMRELSEDDLNEFARELSGEVDVELSLNRAREMASEQFAVLDPINLLSFPYPEIRAILVGRFGPNSVTARLRDLYDLESSEEVRGVIIEAMHARIHWKEINARERHELLSHAREILLEGYEHGNSLIAARAAFYLLAEVRSKDLPAALQRAHTDLHELSIERLRTRDRIGVVRIIGPRIESESLLKLVAEERHPFALEVDLNECLTRWGNGLLPATDPSSPEGQREFWTRIGNVMLHRLGLSDVPHPSLRVLLEAGPEPGEPRWKTQLRALALIAIDEAWGPELP